MSFKHFNFHVALMLFVMLFLIAISDGKFIYQGEILNFRFYGQPCTLQVCHVSDYSGRLSGVETVTASMEDLRISHDSNEQNIQSSKFYKVTKETKVHLNTDGQEAKTNPMEIKLADVGGLDLKISTIKEIASVQLQSTKLQTISGKKKITYFAHIFLFYLIVPQFLLIRFCTLHFIFRFTCS